MYQKEKIRSRDCLTYRDIFDKITLMNDLIHNKIRQRTPLNLEEWSNFSFSEEEKFIYPIKINVDRDCVLDFDKSYPHQIMIYIMNDVNVKIKGTQPSDVYLCGNNKNLTLHCSVNLKYLDIKQSNLSLFVDNIEEILLQNVTLKQTRINSCYRLRWKDNYMHPILSSARVLEMNLFSDLFIDHKDFPLLEALRLNNSLEHDLNLTINHSNLKRLNIIQIINQRPQVRLQLNTPMLDKFDVFSEIPFIPADDNTESLLDKFDIDYLKIEKSILKDL